MLRAYMIYTGPDGNSHIKRGTIADGALVNAVSVSFKESPAFSEYDWHDAPISQYVITLSGILEFTMADGQTFNLHPGEVLVATDTTGTGHKWRLINDEPWKRVYVIYQEDAHTHFIADE